jgi:pyrroline-5-carboxylate reductase
VKPTVFLGAGRITGALVAGLRLAQYGRQQCTNSRSTRFGRRNALLGQGGSSLEHLLQNAATPGGVAAAVMSTRDKGEYTKIVEVGVSRWYGTRAGEPEAYWGSERKPIKDR